MNKQPTVEKWYGPEWARKLLIWLGWFKVVKPVEKKFGPVSKKKIKRGKLQRCPVCDKTMYNEALGKREAERIGKITGTKLRAYRCQFCEAWHLTHQKNKLLMH